MDSNLALITCLQESGLSTFHDYFLGHHTDMLQMVYLNKKWSKVPVIFEVMYATKTINAAIIHTTDMATVKTPLSTAGQQSRVCKSFL